MDNQHQHIKGYRDLTAEEIALMNEVKAKAAEVGTLVEKLRERLPAFKMDGEPVQVGDQTLIGVTEEAFETDRWMTIGQDHLQQGFMALTRAVARAGGQPGASINRADYKAAQALACLRTLGDAAQQRRTGGAA